MNFIGGENVIPRYFYDDFYRFRDFRDPVDESLEKKRRKQIKETIKGG